MIIKPSVPRDQFLFDPMPALQRAQMIKIHNASMDLLGNVGVVFNEKEALKIFKNHGLKVDDKVVFFSENQVLKALETVPSQFFIKSRNDSGDVPVGENEFIFAPGCAATFLSLPDGKQRNAVMSDHDEFCKLVQTSRIFPLHCFMMVKPSDIPQKTAHLDLFFSNLVLCDKPFMGRPNSRQEAKDCIDMTAIVWGGMDKLRNAGPVMLSLIDSLSPMQFSKEMTGSLIEMASMNQACIIASNAMIDSSEMNAMMSILAVCNAEILAGITLNQLVKTGAPVIYGSAPLFMDQTTGEQNISCQGFSLISSVAAQLARFYHLPSQSGSGLTDAHLVDGQACAESSIALTTAVHSGFNVITNSAGVLSCYRAMSYEKFLLDEEICSILSKLSQQIEISGDFIDMEIIKTMVANSNYQQCSEVFKVDFADEVFLNRLHYADWVAAGCKRIDQVSRDRLIHRLAVYEKPYIDPDIEERLAAFVTQRKSDYAHLL